MEQLKSKDQDELEQRLFELKGEHESRESELLNEISDLKLQ